jgi:hypothetical protein
MTVRKKLSASLAALQADLKLGLRTYNEERPPHGRWCYGRTPLHPFTDTLPLAKEKW